MLAKWVQQHTESVLSVLCLATRGAVRRLSIPRGTSESFYTNKCIKVIYKIKENCKIITKVNRKVTSISSSPSKKPSSSSSCRQEREGRRNMKGLLSSEESGWKDDVGESCRKNQAFNHHISIKIKRLGTMFFLQPLSGIHVVPLKQEQSWVGRQKHPWYPQWIAYGSVKQAWKASWTQNSPVKKDGIKVIRENASFQHLPHEFP